MAHPTPSDFVTTDITSAGTSHVVNIPSSAVAGERVFIAFGYGVTGNTISFPAGTGLVVEKQVEQAVGGTNGLYCMVYEVQGAETTITLASSVSTKAAAVACLVQGDEDPGTQAPEFSTGASGSNAPPNPDAVTPTGGSKDYLFIIAGSVGGETALTAADADYSNFTEADSGTAGAVTSNSRTAIATRQLTAAASDDPDAFTGGDGTGEWAAMTIAFHPTSGAAPRTAAIDSDLPAFASASTAEVLLEVAVDSDLPAFVSAAVAEVLLEAAIDSDLPAFTTAAAAVAESDAEVTIASALPAFTQAAIAEALLEAVVASDLPAFTQAAIVESLLESAVASDLPAFTQASLAEVLAELTAGSDLPAFTQAATAFGEGGAAEAAIASLLPAFVQAAVAEVLSEVTIASALPAFAQDASAELMALELDASVASDLPAFTQHARAVFGGGGKEGYVVWRYTRNPDKTRRRLPFAGGRYQ